MAKNFHNDMAGYLDKRLSEKKQFSIFKGEPKAEFKEIDEVEEEIEQMKQEDQYDDEEPRKGFLSKIFGGMFGKEDDFEGEMEESNPVLDEDVKKVLRISFDWINQLEPDKKVKFKHSQDFVEYKAVLKKYGLLRDPHEVKNAQEQ